MMCSLKSCLDLSRKLVKTFRNDTSGSVTVDYVLWFPLFMAFVIFVAEVSIIFTTNAMMWDTARETARRMAIHSLDTVDAKQFISSRLGAERDDYTVLIQNAGDEVSVDINIILSTTPFVAKMLKVDWNHIEANVIMMKEPI